MKPNLYLIIISVFVISASYGQSNTTLSNLSSPTAINQDLLPNGNNSRNLGSSSKSWRILYIDSGIYLKDVLFIHKRGSQNSFVGEGAGSTLTTGNNSVAFGYYALHTVKSNSANTAFGAQALFKNTAANNTAVGYRALYSNTTATLNTAIGYQALYSNTTGTPNTAVGWGALYSNTTGIENTAVGQGALYQNTIGYDNIALGRGSLFSNTAGNDNTATGFKALFSNINGQSNTAFGSLALNKNTAANNTAVGFQALYSNTTATANTAVGLQSLYNNVTGDENTAVGGSALASNTTGISNTALGQGALASNVTGEGNVGIGVSADDEFANSSFNTIIGYMSHIEGSNSIVIGKNAYTNTSNLALLGSTTTAFCGGYANWTNYASDRRVKTQVKENVKGLDFIRRLRPVTYHLDLKSLYKIQGISPYGKQQDKMTAAMRGDIDKNIQYKEAVLMSGFIAQEVEKAAQESDYDFDGVKKPQNDKDNYGLSYATFVVPLVKAVQELDKKNDQLNRNNELLEARIAELERLVKGLIQSKSINTGDSYLSQNIPNPANGKTIIPFLIAKGSHSAMIKIIQSGSGKTIQTIPVDVNAAQVYYNTNLLSAGSYMYSLIVDGKQVDSKQMTLLR